MFKYTKASVNILVDDFKIFAKIFKYVAMVFTVGFLVFKILTKSGFMPVNIGLLAAFVVFTVLDFILEKAELKSARKFFKRFYKWLKILTKIFTLGMAVYDLYKAPASINNSISIILTTLMILLWIVSFVAEIAVEVVTDRTEEMLIAIKADVDDIKRPFVTVSNTFKKWTGREVVVEKPNKKKDKVLDKLKRRIVKDEIEEEDDDE